MAQEGVAKNRAGSPEKEHVQWVLDAGTDMMVEFGVAERTVGDPEQKVKMEAEAEAEHHPKGCLAAVVVLIYEVDNNVSQSKDRRTFKIVWWRTFRHWNVIIAINIVTVATGWRRTFRHNDVII